MLVCCGNLAYALANQKFEQDLARKQGLNLDAQADTPYAVDASGNPIYMKQSRGDKADDFGKINLDGRSSRPFQSNYGASQIVSYSPPNPNRQKRLGKTPEQAQAMADVTTRGDKADDLGGDPYKGLNVTSQPFKSDFGATTIKSYTPRSNFQRMSADLNRLRRKY